MILHVDQDDYHGETAHVAAVKVLIHPQDVMPFPQDGGFSAAPGKVSFVQIKQVDTNCPFYIVGGSNSRPPKLCLSII